MSDVTVRKADQLPKGLMDQMAKDAAKHQQEFAPDQLIIPRISILQDLSPQVKERNVAYVPGAKPGLIFNNVANTLSTGILFTPAKFFVRYIAWEDDRGGLVDQNLTKEQAEQFEENGIAQWRGEIIPRGKEKPVLCDIIETPEWVGIASAQPDEDGVIAWGPMPVAISFPSTKAKSARKINTAIDLTEVQGAKGPFRPPAFYHQFELTTAVETSGKDEWWGWVVNRLGWSDEHSIEKAKALKVAFDDDKATVDEAGARG